MNDCTQRMPALLSSVSGYAWLNLSLSLVSDRCNRTEDQLTLMQRSSNKIPYVARKSASGTRYET
jgi:hypothetical protein